MAAALGSPQAAGGRVPTSGCSQSRRLVRPPPRCLREPELMGLREQTSTCHCANGQLVPGDPCFAVRNSKAVKALVAAAAGPPQCLRGAIAGSPPETGLFCDSLISLWASPWRGAGRRVPAHVYKYAHAGHQPLL